MCSETSIIKPRADAPRTPAQAFYNLALHFLARVEHVLVEVQHDRLALLLECFKLCFRVLGLGAEEETIVFE